MIKNTNVMVTMLVAVGLMLGTDAYAKKITIEVPDDVPAVKYENVLSTNVWPWMAGFFNVGYDRLLGENMSIRPRASYWVFSNSGTWALWALGIDLNFHPMGKGLDGWFIGPRYDAWLLSVSDNGASGTGAAHLFGAMAGYNWIFQGGFLINVSLGAQTILSTSVTTSSGTETFDFPYKGLLPCFNVEIGWAF